MDENQQKHERDVDTKMELEDRPGEITQNEIQNQGDRKV